MLLLTKERRKKLINAKKKHQCEDHENHKIVKYFPYSFKYKFQGHR